jgi:hypothetical protein
MAEAVVASASRGRRKCFIELGRISGAVLILILLIILILRHHPRE